MFYPQLYKQNHKSFPPKQNRSPKEVIRQITIKLLKKRQFFSFPQHCQADSGFSFPLIDTAY